MIRYPNTSVPPASHRRILGLLVALLVSAPIAPRLSAQARSEPVAPPADSEEIVLSPFTILASQDKGYQATSTLAGTRLRSNLSDIASPISIFTKDLLKDIAATNFQDAMRYSINVENEREYASDDTEGESIASTTQNRVRGLGVGTQTRNFFKTNVRADSYNTERLTVSSGPSSILFGIGSPAGTIDSTPITANLRKVSAEVSVRADNNGSIRGSLDINVPVVTDVFALRVADMAQTNKTYRKPEYDDERRHFITATYHPFSGTTIQVNYENFKDDRIFGREALVGDNVSDWIKAGKPVYNAFTNQWSLDKGVTWGTWTPSAGQNWISGNTDRVFINGGNKGGAETQSLLWNGSAVSYNQNQLAAKTFSDASVLDPDVNYYGKGDKTRLGGYIFSVLWDQQIVKNLDLQVGYSKENNRRTQTDNFRNPISIEADVNYYLPYAYGQTSGPLVKNPNVGRYFIQSPLLGYSDRQGLETRRASLTYNLDLAEYGLRWLGKYTLLGMWQRETADVYKFKQFMYTNPTSSYFIGPINSWESNRNDSRAYLNLPGLGGDSAGVSYAGDFKVAPWANVSPGRDGPNNSETRVDGRLFAVQGFLFKDSLVVTYGYRRDEQKVYSASYPTQDALGRAVIAGVGYNATPVIQAGLTRTLGLVYHTPLKWLSLLYNHSNSFNPNGNFKDWFGTALPPGSGKGEDIGISVDLVENKLSARITRFTNTSKDNVEYDWLYEEPKWSLIGNMDAPWANVYNYALQSGHPEDINQKTVALFSNPDSVRATRDYKAEGYEMELFYKPTSQLDIRFTLAKEEATNLKVVPGVQAYVDSRLAVWQKYYGYQWYPADWSAAYKAGPVADWKTDPNSVGYHLNYSEGGALPRLAFFDASTGLAVQRDRKWRGNLIANYRFTGPLNGFSVGGGSRWRSAAVIGYFGKANPSSATAPLVPDLQRPVDGKEILVYDAWFGYTRDFKVSGKKLNWSAQFNIRNLLNDDKIVPIAAGTDGKYTAYAKNEPINLVLTNTLKF